MAKMKVQFPVEDKEIRTWNGKRVCDVIMKADNGMSYTLFSFEGDAAWNAKAGDEIEVDIKEEATASTRGKVTLPRQNRPGGGGGWRQKEAQKPNAEYAKERAQIAAATYRYIAEHTATLTPATTSEDIRSMVNTILMDI